jgi:ribonucleoside-triphosphate reductase
MTRPLRVRLRDGSEAPFNGREVADEIFRAAQAAGVDDRPLADELADVVALFLERRHDDTTPSLDEIEDMIEKVLLETGNVGPAKAFILNRERRTQLRHGEAAADAATPSPVQGVLVESTTHATATPWDRRKISDAILREARVEAEVAEAVAEAVEQRILGAGIERVSTRLIRELVTAELFTRGLEEPSSDQAVVGLPRYDLRAILSGGEHRSPDGVARAIEQTTLGQFALEEIYSAEVSRAHVGGVLHLHGVGTPLRLHGLHIAPHELLAHGLWLPGRPSLSGPPTDARDLTEVLPALLAGWGRLVAGALDVGDLASSYALVPPAPEALPDEARRVIRNVALAGEQLADVGTELSLNLTAPPAGLDGAERGAGGHLFPLDTASATHAALTAALADAWASLSATPLRNALPRLTVHVTEATFAHRPLRESLRRLCRAARAGRGVTFAFERDGTGLQLQNRYLSRARDAAELRQPGGSRLAVPQAVTLNVARAGLEAGPHNMDGFFAELERGLALAFGAARERRAFLQRMAGHAGAPLAAACAPGPDGRPGLDLERGHALLGVVGLHEAVGALCGPEPRQDAWIRTEARVASFIYFRAAEEARRHAFGLSFDEDVSGAVRHRLARCDADRFPGRGEPSAYGQGLTITGTDPSAMLDTIRRRASLHALVDPRVAIHGLPIDDPQQPELAFDMCCEVFQNTHAVFLRFA